MARKSNKTTTTQQAPAKVAKRTRKAASSQQAKAAEAAPRKGRKAKASEQATTASGQQARRGQYADKRITVTEAGKAASPRGLRGDRWEIVKKAKNTNDVLGTTYVGHDGVERTITSAKIANFVERGFIELS